MLFCCMLRPNPESMWKQDKLTNHGSRTSIYSSVTLKVPGPGRKITFTTKF